MGKLKFIQDNVIELDQHYKLQLNSNLTEYDSGITSSDLDLENMPEVTPMTQAEILESGDVKVKKFKPLSYALMSWVKTFMKLRDTIDISDDENKSQFEITCTSENGFEFHCFFNTDELRGLISFYMYVVNHEFSADQIEDLKDFVIQKNIECMTGQVQLFNSEDAYSLRYYAGVSVRNIASDDSDYVGNYQIHPQLYQNLFDDGREWMDDFMTEIEEVI